jgi:hypothetical protein
MSIKQFLFLLVAVIVLVFAFTHGHAAGTVTKSTYVQLTRGGTVLSDTTTPKLGCPVPKTEAECDACMAKMIDAESKTRTTGYITYKCLNVSQSYVKFSKTAPLPPVVEPVANLQVYACPEVGANGRILESATVQWPNCPTAAFKNPSKLLVVAVNPGSLPLMWQRASELTDDKKIWIQEGTVGSWKRVGDINWNTVTAPVAGTANLKWTPSPTAGVTGYRLLYGTKPDELVRSIDTIPVSPRELKIQGLAPGQYFFAMQAYMPDEHGPLSDILAVTIK